MAEISIKLAKVEEATRKKDEITNEFITQTKEQLETKMETHVEKREAIISDMKEKLKVKGERKLESEIERGTDLKPFCRFMPRRSRRRARLWSSKRPMSKRPSKRN